MVGNYTVIFSGHRTVLVAVSREEERKKVGRAETETRIERGARSDIVYRLYVL